MTHQDSWWYEEALRKYGSGKSPNSRNCFSSSLLSLARLGQNCEILSWWFLHKMALFYTKQCRTPSLFHKVLETAHLGTVALYVTPFSVCMHSKQWHYSRLLNWKYSQCDGLVKTLCLVPSHLSIRWICILKHGWFTNRSLWWLSNVTSFQLCRPHHYLKIARNMIQWHSWKGAPS